MHIYPKERRVFHRSVISFEQSDCDWISARNGPLLRCTSSFGPFNGIVLWHQRVGRMGILH